MATPPEALGQLEQGFEVPGGLDGRRKAPIPIMNVSRRVPGNEKGVRAVCSTRTP
jgi:hypothetical protein